MSRPDARPDGTAADDEHTAGWMEEVLFGAAERLTFFTDAVAAIALTLLAIELPLPSGHTTTQLLHSAYEHRNEYLAFVISFLVIAAHWRFHHTLFRYVRRVSHQVVSLNFAWLFLLVITPFTTKLLSVGDGNILRFAMYATTEALQFALFAVITEVIIRQRLAHSQVPPERLRATFWRVLPFAVAFAVSIPLYPLIGGVGYWSWAVIPLIGRLLRPVFQRRFGAKRDTEE